MSSVQGIMASRGLGASSSEANALAQTNQQFQEQVLNTGLNIGLTSQQNKANAIQQQINNLFSQTGQAMGISGQAAGQQSAQNLGESNLIASLPSFLNASSAQMAAFNKALNPNTGGFQSTFNQVTGDIGKATAALTNIADIGSMFATRGATLPGGGSPSSAMANLSQIPSATFQAPNLNAENYNQYGTNPLTGRPVTAQFE